MLYLSHMNFNNFHDSTSTFHISLKDRPKNLLIMNRPIAIATLGEPRCSIVLYAYNTIQYSSLYIYVYLKLSTLLILFKLFLFISASLGQFD